MPIGDMWLKNITSSPASPNIQGAHGRADRADPRGRIDPKVIISHRMPLSEAAEGYELFDQKEALKVVLDPRAECLRRRGGEMLEGLMQDDYQLTLQHVLERMRGRAATARS